MASERLDLVGFSSRGGTRMIVTCQVMRGTMQSKPKRDREGSLLLMERVGKVLMSDLPTPSITHSKFGSGLCGHLEEEFLCKAKALEWIV